MTDARRPSVSRTAYLLGYAGLLPQVAAAALIALGRGRADPVGWSAVGQTLALFYGALILSFLGGIWWGFAVRRGAGQGALAGLAVLPSLGAFAIGLWRVLYGGSAAGPLIALGAAVTTTLLVDRRLVATGEAPDGWMRLRAPLSLGLGGLTVLAGLLA